MWLSSSRQSGQQYTYACEAWGNQSKAVAIVENEKGPERARPEDVDQEEIHFFPRLWQSMKERLATSDRSRWNNALPPPPADALSMT